MKSRLNKFKKIIRLLERRNFAVIISLAALSVFVFAGRDIARDYSQRGKLTVAFFNIGQGDAALIRMPNGDDVLIDGGPDKAVLAKLGRALPFYDRKIELVILTHPHADHLNGLLAVFDRYKIDKVLMTGIQHKTQQHERWLEILRRKNVQVDFAVAGEVYKFGNGNLEIIAPFERWDGKYAGADKIGEGGGLNDTSVIARACLSRRCFLFMGDATSAVESELVSRGAELKADVLKVGHHGSRYSTSEEFLSAAAANYAVISSGKNNYGHPSPRVIRRLERLGAKVFRTDLDGDVFAETDGEFLKMKSEK